MLFVVSVGFCRLFGSWLGVYVFVSACVFFLFACLRVRVCVVCVYCVSFFLCFGWFCVLVFLFACLSLSLSLGGCVFASYLGVGVGVGVYGPLRGQVLPLVLLQAICGWKCVKMCKGPQCVGSLRLASAGGIRILKHLLLIQF